MCRLLGVVSTTAQPLTTLLADDLPPYTALSAEHCDGWGVAHWNDRDALELTKAAEAAAGSSGYREALAGAHTDAALLHLRKASSGMDNTALNTHPFTDGRIAFAHNGWASDAAKLDAMVTSAGGPACAGTTDSERYFSLLRAALTGAAPEVALTAVSTAVFDAMPTEALNCLLLTEDALYAYTSYDGTRPTASGKDPHESYEMGFRVLPDRVIVASSGWAHDDAPWEPLRNGQILRVGRRDLHTSVHRLVPAHALAAVGRLAAPAGLAG